MLIVFTIILAISTICFFILFLVNRKTRVEIDYDREKYNSELIQQSQLLENKNQQLLNKYENIQIEVNGLCQKKNQLHQDIKNETEQIKNLQETAATVSANAQAEAERSLDLAVERMANNMVKYQEEAKDGYLNTLEDVAGNFQLKFQELLKEQQELEEKLETQRSITEAAIAANLRAEEDKMKEQFYQIHISTIDMAEIFNLRSVQLRNPVPLNKVIWKVYYEKPTTAMIGRVVGQGIHTGIYKITNKVNGMCYVGQAVDIASRWKQHIKRGLGAEERTHNKLYPAMEQYGVENFTFEIIEECDRSKLDQQEDYWRNYFHAKDFGYSIK